MIRTVHRCWQLLSITLVALLGSVFPGCQPTAPPANAQVAASTKPTPKIPAGDLWDALFIQGAKVGYSRTEIQPLEENGQKLVKVDSETKLAIVRFGEKNEQTLSVNSVETPEGGLVRFESRTAFGSEPAETTGAVNAGQTRLEITTKSGGKTATATLPWSPENRGFFGSEEVLRIRPMIPGEHRSFKMLMPILNQIAAVKLIARGKESTKLLDGQMHTLMRVDSTTSLPDGNSIVSTIWTDTKGETIKTRTDAMQQETFRVPKTVATAEGPAGQFDLGIDTMIKIDPPLANPHGTRKVRYGLELKGGDPAKAFINCPSQQVKSISDSVAEVTVSAIRPDAPPEAPGGVTTPVDADQKPNTLIQSDEPAVVELANEAAPKSDDPWQTATALEKFVHDGIKKKNFSQAFASAAEVAKSREGDCTEHAVLLAALLRARGIPARVAIGLVYVDRDRAFGYHMWTEAYIKDRWIPLDATLGQGGIGGAHLKLLDSNLEGASAYSAFLPVAQVLGRLKIKVLDAE